jgi:hypothetical protein
MPCPATDFIVKKRISPSLKMLYMAQETEERPGTLFRTSNIFENVDLSWSQSITRPSTVYIFFVEYKVFLHTTV